MEEPGIIDTYCLLVKDSNSYNGYRPKSTLQPPSIDADGRNASPGHYRYNVVLNSNTNKIFILAYFITYKLEGSH